MNIQWFPGHMAKAIREAEQNLKIVDAVVYVLDSRAVQACINNHFLKLIGNKPVLYVLNKADLADGKTNREWIKHLTKEGTLAVSVIATRSGGAKVIIPEIKTLVSAQIEKWKKKGINYTPKVMIAGIPNTGKSSIINSLCGAGRTKTGNKPGVTRGRQWVRVGNIIDMLDTPGVLAPKLDDTDLAKHLAFIGSIRDDILDIVELAREFLDEMNANFKDNLINRYGASIDALEDIAKSRGYLLKGGELDVERTAKAVLDDFRSGRLGNISLENPPVVEK